MQMNGSTEDFGKFRVWLRPRDLVCLVACCHHGWKKCCFAKSKGIEGWLPSEVTCEVRRWPRPIASSQTQAVMLGP